MSSTHTNDEQRVNDNQEDNVCKGKSNSKSIKFDSIANVPYVERAGVLSSTWLAATQPLASSVLLHNLHRITLLYILQEEWSSLDSTQKDDLRVKVEGCAVALEGVGNQGGSRRLRHLLEVSHEPWRHPVLKDIMEGRTPAKEDVEKWCRDEGIAGGLERLRQLSMAGSACHSAALRMSRALLSLEQGGQGVRRTTLDTMLVLLFKKGDTRTLITEIKALDSKEVISVIDRLSNKDKSSGRLWKHAHDTAVLCAQVTVAACLVRPVMEGELFTLSSQLASFYSSQPDKLPGVFRKLLQPADTALHIYTVCRAVQHKFPEVMRSFIFELYIRALTTGMNEMERHKMQDENSENAKTISHTLARWFHSLAEYLSMHKSVSAECILTAFSLHPSRQYYTKVQECSEWMCKNKDQISAENPTDSNITTATEGIDRLGLESTSEETSLKVKVLPLYSDGIGVDGKGLAKDLVSGEVLDAEVLGLNADACRDLAVLLSGPRLKMLTWELSWEKLSSHCLSYMEDTAEGTKTVTKELKFVKLDYSQFEYQEPEIHDIYYGIEKGYEHHLEFEDEEEEDYWEDDLNKKSHHSSSESVVSVRTDAKPPAKKSNKQAKKKSSKDTDSDSEPLISKKNAKKEKKKPDQNSKIKCKVKKKKDSDVKEDKEKKKKKAVGDAVPVNIKIKPCHPDDDVIFTGIELPPTKPSEPRTFYDLSKYEDMKALLHTSKVINKDEKHQPSTSKPKTLTEKVMAIVQRNEKFENAGIDLTKTGQNAQTSNFSYNTYNTPPVSQKSSYQIPPTNQNRPVSLFRQQMDRYEAMKRMQLEREINEINNRPKPTKGSFEEFISRSQMEKYKKDVDIAAKLRAKLDYQEKMRLELKNQHIIKDEQNIIQPKQEINDRIKPEPEETANTIKHEKDEHNSIKQERESQCQIHQHRVQQEKEVQNKMQHEREIHNRIQQKKERDSKIQQEREMENKIQQEKDRQNRIQLEREMQNRIQQEKAKQNRFQLERERQKRIQQECEKRIRMQKERDESQKRIQQELEESQKRIQQELEESRNKMLREHEKNKNRIQHEHQKCQNNIQQKVVKEKVLLQKPVSQQVQSNLPLNITVKATPQSDSKFLLQDALNEIKSTLVDISDKPMKQTIGTSPVAPSISNTDHIQETSATKPTSVIKNTLSNENVDNKAIRPTKILDFSGSSINKYEYISPVKISPNALKEALDRKNTVTISQHGSVTDINISCTSLQSQANEFVLKRALIKNSKTSPSKPQRSDRFSCKRAEELEEVNIKIANPYGLKVRDVDNSSKVKNLSDVSKLSENADPFSKLKTLSQVSLHKPKEAKSDTKQPAIPVYDVSLSSLNQSTIQQQMDTLKKSPLSNSDTSPSKKSINPPTPLSCFQAFLNEMQTMVNAGLDNTKPSKLISDYDQPVPNYQQFIAQQKKSGDPVQKNQPNVGLSSNRGVAVDSLKKETVPQTYARKNYSTQMKKQSLSNFTQVSTSIGQASTTDNSAVLRMPVIPFDTPSSSNHSKEVKHSPSKTQPKVSPGVHDKASKLQSTKPERNKKCKMEFLKNPIKIPSTIVLEEKSPRPKKKQSPVKGKLDKSQGQQNTVPTASNIQSTANWNIKKYSNDAGNVTQTSQAPLPSFSTFSTKTDGTRMSNVVPMNYSNNVYPIRTDSKNPAQNKGIIIQSTDLSTSSQPNVASTSQALFKNMHKTDSNVTLSDNNISTNHISINTSSNVAIKNLLLFRRPKIISRPTHKLLDQSITTGQLATPVQPLEQRNDYKDFSDVLDVIENDLKMSLHCSGDTIKFTSRDDVAKSLVPRTSKSIEELNKPTPEDWQMDKLLDINIDNFTSKSKLLSNASQNQVKDPKSIGKIVDINDNKTIDSTIITSSPSNVQNKFSVDAISPVKNTYLNNEILNMWQNTKDLSCQDLPQLPDNILNDLCDVSDISTKSSKTCHETVEVKERIQEFNTLRENVTSDKCIDSAMNILSPKNSCNKLETEPISEIFERSGTREVYPNVSASSTVKMYNLESSEKNKQETTDSDDPDLLQININLPIPEIFTLDKICEAAVCSEDRNSTMSDNIKISNVCPDQLVKENCNNSQSGNKKGEHIGKEEGSVDLKTGQNEVITANHQQVNKISTELQKHISSSLVQKSTTDKAITLTPITALSCESISTDSPTLKQSSDNSNSDKMECMKIEERNSIYAESTNHPDVLSHRDILLTSLSKNIKLDDKGVDMINEISDENKETKKDETAIVKEIKSDNTDKNETIIRMEATETMCDDINKSPSVTTQAGGVNPENMKLEKTLTSQIVNVQSGKDVKAIDKIIDGNNEQEVEVEKESIDDKKIKDCSQILPFNINVSKSVPDVSQSSTECEVNIVNISSADKIELPDKKELPSFIKICNNDDAKEDSHVTSENITLVSIIHTVDKKIEDVLPKNRISTETHIKEVDDVKITHKNNILVDQVDKINDTKVDNVNIISGNKILGVASLSTDIEKNEVDKKDKHKNKEENENNIHCEKTSKEYPIVDLTDVTEIIAIVTPVQVENKDTSAKCANRPPIIFPSSSKNIDYKINVTVLPHKKVDETKHSNSNTSITKPSLAIEAKEKDDNSLRNRIKEKQFKDFKDRYKESIAKFPSSLNKTTIKNKPSTNSKIEEIILLSSDDEENIAQTAKKTVEKVITEDNKNKRQRKKAINKRENITEIRKTRLRMKKVITKFQKENKLQKKKNYQISRKLQNSLPVPPSFIQIIDMSNALKLKKIKKRTTKKGHPYMVVSPNVGLTKVSAIPDKDLERFKMLCSVRLLNNDFSLFETSKENNSKPVQLRSLSKRKSSEIESTLQDIQNLNFEYEEVQKNTSLPNKRSRRNQTKNAQNSNKMANMSTSNNIHQNIKFNSSSTIKENAEIPDVICLSEDSEKEDDIIKHNTKLDDCDTVKENDVKLDPSLQDTANKQETNNHIETNKNTIESSCTTMTEIKEQVIIKDINIERTAEDHIEDVICIATIDAPNIEAKTSLITDIKVEDEDYHDPHNTKVLAQSDSKDIKDNASELVIPQVEDNKEYTNTNTQESPTSVEPSDMVTSGSKNYFKQPVYEDQRKSNDIFDSEKNVDHKFSQNVDLIHQDRIEVKEIDTNVSKNKSEGPIYYDQLESHKIEMTDFNNAFEPLTNQNQIYSDKMETTNSVNESGKIVDHKFSQNVEFNQDQTEFNEMDTIVSKNQDQVESQIGMTNSNDNLKPSTNENQIDSYEIETMNSVNESENMIDLKLQRNIEPIHQDQIEFNKIDTNVSKNEAEGPIFHDQNESDEIGLVNSNNASEPHKEINANVSKNESEGLVYQDQAESQMGMTESNNSFEAPTNQNLIDSDEIEMTNSVNESEKLIDLKLPQNIELIHQEQIEFNKIDTNVSKNESEGLICHDQIESDEIGFVNSNNATEPLTNQDQIHSSEIEMMNSVNEFEKVVVQEISTNRDFINQDHTHSNNMEIVLKIKSEQLINKNKIKFSEIGIANSKNACEPLNNQDQISDEVEMTTSVNESEKIANPEIIDSVVKPKELTDLEVIKFNEMDVDEIENNPEITAAQDLCNSKDCSIQGQLISESAVIQTIDVTNELKQLHYSLNTINSINQDQIEFNEKKITHDQETCKSNVTVTSMSQNDLEHPVDLNFGKIKSNFKNYEMNNDEKIPIILDQTECNNARLADSMNESEMCVIQDTIEFESKIIPEKNINISEKIGNVEDNSDACKIESRTVDQLIVNKHRNEYSKPVVIVNKLTNHENDKCIELMSLDIQQKTSDIVLGSDDQDPKNTSNNVPEIIQKNIENLSLRIEENFDIIPKVIESVNVKESVLESTSKITKNDSNDCEISAIDCGSEIDEIVNVKDKFVDSKNFHSSSLSQLELDKLNQTIGEVCDMERFTIPENSMNSKESPQSDIESSINIEVCKNDDNRNLINELSFINQDATSEKSISTKALIMTNDAFEELQRSVNLFEILNVENAASDDIENSGPSNLDHNMSSDQDFAIILNKPVKTYLRSQKRKITSRENLKRKTSKLSKINLPKVLAKENTTLSNSEMYDCFTVKEVMKLDNYQDLETLEDFTKEDMEVASIENTCEENEINSFLSHLDYLSNDSIADDSRESFYSPIFDDDNFMNNVRKEDKFVVNKLDIEESRIRNRKYEISRIRKRELRSERHKTSKYDREGFGFRSDRDISSDLLNGRHEGPAALSDSTHPRLPKTLDNKISRSQGENGISHENGSNRLLKLQENLENYYSNKKMVLKRVGNVGRVNVTPLSENILVNELRHIMCSNIVTKYENVWDKKKMCDKEYVKSILAKVPGMSDFSHMKIPPPRIQVNVVQVGQLPVSSAQQSPLPGTPTRSNSTNEFLENVTNNSEYREHNNEEQTVNQGNDNQIIKEVNNEEAVGTEQNLNEDESSAGECQIVSETNNDELQNDCQRIDVNTNESQPSFVQITSSQETITLNPVTTATSNSIPTNSSSLDGQVQLIFAPQSMIHHNFMSSENQEHKDIDGNNTENNTAHVMQTATPTTTSFNPVSRAQTLVNILSQKIIRPPVSGINTSQVQMATFPKGTPINALSLQQALAQILPPPLSQASGDGSQNVGHPTGPQVVHIVQGKTAGQPGGSFSGLLMDNSQQSVVNVSGGTQVLHIVQGKNTVAGNNVLGQSQLSGTTFGGLSLVDAGSQQGGNQVLHIVNTGGQSKNNTATAQVLKRVNLLTSLANAQGNEQKMVQFVCKSADGKSIQLNAQHQRGMVLRLQPIETATSIAQQKPVENQVSTSNTIIQQVPKKSPTSSEQSQEIKSRSIYEENYAKFIQNSKLSPVTTEKSSTILPKFNQAFGKSIYQESVTKSETETNQNQTVGNDQSQELSNAIGLAQMGQLSSPPLLIRKTQPSGATQNIIGQVKQGVTPMNIQTMHGGVIYTRQIPVNIGGGQTINLITVPSTELLDEAHLQAIHKQVQEKNNEQQHAQQIEQQVIKLVPQQEQNQQNVTLHVDTASEDANQSFADQQQTNVNTHPLLTQMRIKVPMLSKGGAQMVTGARVVRPVLQIQRNIIPGTNPQVYQQLVLTTAPALRPPTPVQQQTVRPARAPTVATPHQESNLSSSTLEQLREFDMVLEQVKERSTVQPGSNSNSTFSESSPRQNIDSDVSVVQTSQPSVSQTPQREVLYSIGPNHTVNVTYVNKNVLSGNPTVLTTYPQNQETTTIVNMGQQNTPQLQISHNLANSINNPKPTTPTKVNNKNMKPKTSKPPSITPSSSKASPVAPKTSVQKPLEDEQTTQRILYILAEYKEQVENSPDKDKPAPRRRSNPPTNPSTSSKRKKGSSSSSKKGSNGQSLQEMSPLGDDTGHTMGSEDSSCGLSQGECAENSIQGPESQSPQGSPQKASRKLVFPQEPETSNPPVTQPQRNVIIADGQTIAMTRPGPGGKATAVLMPANYILPMSMVKGGQQITIVTNQGPKILNVPQGEGGATNTLFLQRLISPAGLKPMLARPGQVRQVRLPANAVQNLQAFNLAQNLTGNQETTWISGQQVVNNQQPKLVVEYSPNVNVANHDLNPDSVKSEASDAQSLKEENMSISGGSEITTPRHSEASSDDLSSKNRSSDEGIFSAQTDSATEDSVQGTLQNRSDQILHHIQVSKAPTNTTVNLIQVHSLNPNEPGKIYSVQNPASLGSLIRLAGKTSLGQTFQTINVQGVNQDMSKVSPDVQECAQNLLLVRKHFDGQYTLTTSNAENALRDVEMKNANLNQQDMQVDASPSPGSQQNYSLGHTDQLDDNLAKVDGDGNVSWSLSSSGSRGVVHGGADSASPGYVTYSADSPSSLVQQAEQADVSLRESDHDRHVLRHEYSSDGGSPAPSTPRHLYHKMFISSPDKADHHSVQDHLKKDEHNQSSTITLHSSNSPSFTIHHHHHGSSGSGSHHHNHHQGSGGTSTTGGHHSAGGHHNNARLGIDSKTPHHILRHKYALMEHELRLQKSLSEECEDLGVDSPSASDLFPEADLLFANSPSSQFDHSQDGQMSSVGNSVNNASNNVTSLPNLQGGVPSGSISLASATLALTRDDNPIDEEFARMHPNTTFHSGEIDMLDDQDDLTFRSSKRSTICTVTGRRNEVIRSVIEGVGSSGMPNIYQPNKVPKNFSLVSVPKRGSINIMSLQSSDDNSEGADDSMNSAESKDGLVNNKHLDGMLNSNITRDVNLSASDSPGCISSGIIQRNVAQVIRHANDEQMLSDKDNGKLCTDESSPGPQNGRSFLLDNNSDIRQGDSMILKTLMMERDGRDGLTCSSPEQHSELFWESNSNSNQSDEPMTHGGTNLLDFSSEDSNKCCKSPPSCEETNSTDSSSIGGMNLNSDKPLRLNSVIKTSGSTSTAADGPILHSALTSNMPIVVQDRKLDLNLHKSDSNTSTSPDTESMDTSARRPWSKNIKNSGVRRMLSPRSLSTEINMGAEIETSSSEGVSILTKSGAIIHSGSSTPEDSAITGRRASLRGSNHAKRSCHCCPPPSPPLLSANPPSSSLSSQVLSSSGQNTTTGVTNSGTVVTTPSRGRNRRRPHQATH